MHGVVQLGLYSAQPHELRLDARCCSYKLRGLTDRARLSQEAQPLRGRRAWATRATSIEISHEFDIDQDVSAVVEGRFSGFVAAEDVETSERCNLHARVRSVIGVDRDLSAQNCQEATRVVIHAHGDADAVVAIAASGNRHDPSRYLPAQQGGLELGFFFGKKSELAFGEA